MMLPVTSRAGGCANSHVRTRKQEPLILGITTTHKPRDGKHLGGTSHTAQDGPRQHPSALMALTEATPTAMLSGSGSRQAPEAQMAQPVCSRSRWSRGSSERSAPPHPGVWPRGRGPESLLTGCQRPGPGAMAAASTYLSDMGAHLPRSHHLRQVSPRGRGVRGQTLSLLSGPTGLCGPAQELQPRPDHSYPWDLLET